MQKLLFLIANGIAGFQDIGIGIAVVAFFSYALGYDVTLASLIFGAVLGVLPDLFDVVPQIVMGHPPLKGEDHHLTFFHRPLYMVPLVAFAGFLTDTVLMGQSFWVYIAPLLVTYHYVHDTWAGIAWLYPFKREYPIPGRGWVPPEECGSTPGHRVWIDTYWYYGSALALQEVAVGSTALFLGGYYEYGIYWGIILFTLSWIGACSYWAVTHALRQRQTI